MRERPNIPEKDLLAFLLREYRLATVKVEFLPLGLDTRAGVFRVVSEHASNFLLKVKSGSLYKPSLVVPRYLRDRGIKAVVAPIPTGEGRLWALIGEWRAVLYPFIEGITTWEPGLTDGQWRNLGASLKQIHEAELPGGGFESIKREMFDPTGYSNWISEFEAQQAGLIGGTENERALRMLWMKHLETIHTGVDQLVELGSMLREESKPQVICHADLHPGNIIRNQIDEAYLIDWDDVMLAPKERDFLYIKGIPVDDSAGQDRDAPVAPFFQGYGETDIDWRALTYYLWERVIQDAIACAQDVYREDLEEETKAEAVELFARVLSKGGDGDRAMSAAAHIP